MIALTSRPDPGCARWLKSRSVCMSSRGRRRLIFLFYIINPPHSVHQFFAICLPEIASPVTRYIFIDSLRTHAFIQVEADYTGNILFTNNLFEWVCLFIKLELFLDKIYFICAILLHLFSIKGALYVRSRGVSFCMGCVFKMRCGFFLSQNM